LDAVVKIIRNDKNVKIDIETFTRLGKIHTIDAVYNSVLRASLDLPQLSFVIDDVTDDYYKALISSLEKQIYILNGHSVQVELEHSF